MKLGFARIYLREPPKKKQNRKNFYTQYFVPSKYHHQLIGHRCFRHLTFHPSAPGRPQWHLTLPFPTASETFRPRFSARRTGIAARSNWHPVGRRTLASTSSVGLFSWFWSGLQSCLRPPPKRQHTLTSQYNDNFFQFFEKPGKNQATFWPKFY